MKGKYRNEEELRSELHAEDEELDLEALLNVQGGFDGHDVPKGNCGLGCYTGGMGKDIQDHDKTSTP